MAPRSSGTAIPHSARTWHSASAGRAHQRHSAAVGRFSKADIVPAKPLDHHGDITTIRSEQDSDSVDGAPVTSAHISLRNTADRCLHVLAIVNALSRPRRLRASIGVGRKMRNAPPRLGERRPAAIPQLPFVYSFYCVRAPMSAPSVKWPRQP